MFCDYVTIPSIRKEPIAKGQVPRLYGGHEGWIGFHNTPNVSLIALAVQNDRDVSLPNPLQL
jgi:hypothetical protein